MTWQAPTYHSEVAALLPAEKRSLEVDHPKLGRLTVSAIDWRMPELNLLDRDFVARLALATVTVNLGLGVVTPPSEDFVLRRRLLAVPPWNINAVFWCDFCRVWRPAFTLVDVGGFPADLTDGRKWACDGCRTRWFRLGKPAGGAPITKRKWAELMRDHQGAPQEFVQNVEAMPDADRTHYSI